LVEDEDNDLIREDDLSGEVTGVVEPEGDVSRPKRLHPLIATADETFRNVFDAVITASVLFTLYELGPLLLRVDWSRVFLIIFALGLLIGFGTLLTFILDMSTGLIVKSVPLFGMLMVLYACVGYSVYRLASVAGQALETVFPMFRDFMM